MTRRYVRRALGRNLSIVSERSLLGAIADLHLIGFRVREWHSETSAVSLNEQAVLALDRVVVVQEGFDAVFLHPFDAQEDCVLANPSMTSVRDEGTITVQGTWAQSRGDASS